MVSTLLITTDKKLIKMKLINLYKNIVRVVIITLLFTTSLSSQTLDEYVEWSIEFANQQMRNTIVELNNDSTKHPIQTNTTNGEWSASARTGWTSGFFSGVAWYLYENTFCDSFWLDVASRWTADLESEKYNTNDHDIGFRIMSSYGNQYRLTKDEQSKDVILTAANSFATRYNSTIGCIRSWSWGSWNYPVIIDNMMNLELLLWASENGGSENLKYIAISHAKKTIENHIRSNGSTYHVVDYNNDGTVIGKSTHQGYSTESTWSRGQAWGIYGFTVMYRFTKNDTFLNVALNLANYFIDNLPADFIPFTDFDAPNIPNTTRDASAAAIACSALFELQGYVENDKYKNAALDILNSLINNYIAKNTVHHSVLKKTTTRYGDTERGLIYADYYFLEALKRYRDLTTNIKLEKDLNNFGFELYQNYPNPFNPSTVIKYRIPTRQSTDATRSNVIIKVYDTLGREVITLINKAQAPGNYSVTFDASSVSSEISSGVYYYQINYGNFSESKKMVLLK